MKRMAGTWRGTLIFLYVAQFVRLDIICTFTTAELQALVVLGNASEESSPNQSRLQV
jgi:hypothetical protein